MVSTREPKGFQGSQLKSDVELEVGAGYRVMAKVGTRRSKRESNRVESCYKADS
jgi:hypothetical protein